MIEKSKQAQRPGVPSHSGGAVAKKRSSNAATERAGVLAMASACNRLGLIWRDLLQEDVGVDATVELCVDELPTGKLIGVQVKSGSSYIRSETEVDLGLTQEPLGRVDCGAERPYSRPTGRT